MGLRGRLLSLTALAVLLPGAVLVVWAETNLERRLVEEEARTLERRARLLTELAGGAPASDSLADRLGEVAGTRVTLIESTGRVAGDSRVPAGRIGEVEDHAGRPEVRAALEGGVGTATRASRTVALSLLYVAVPYGDAVLRVAVPREEVTAPADRLVRVLAALWLGVLLLLALTSGLQARWVAGPLRSLRTTAESMAAGEAARPGARGNDRDEVGRLARALHGVADRLDEAGTVERRESELESVFHRLEEGIVLTDADGVVRRANRAFRRWVGREEVEGHGLRSLFRDPQISDAVERGLAGEETSEEAEVGERSLHVAVRPLEDGMLAVFRDLTRLRRLEGVRRDFVANVSHELKTPLTSVLGFAEALADPDLPGDQVAGFAERILVNGTRMRRLVDDLLDLSRIEGGAWEPEPRTVELEPVATSLWQDLQATGSGGLPGLRIEVEDAPAVRADPEALRQVLRNLFDNARRYAPADGTVRLRSRPDGDRVRIEVVDQGPGIPESHRERVFERFYRIDAGRSRDVGGTGLGLSIVKHLVAAHGGDVGVESRVGEGTTLWLTLPAP